MVLTVEIPQFYKVKRGQTVEKIAEAFALPACAIIGCNRLHEEVREGQILRIPDLKGNLYTVRAGDTKRLLFGNEADFEKRNMSTLFYTGMKVLI
jgi:hypothetical protein